MTSKPRKPRKLKSPRPCRYCGHVSDTHAREGLAQCVSYSCRDMGACGARIRGQARAGKIPVDGVLRAQLDAEIPAEKPEKSAPAP